MERQVGDFAVYRFSLRGFGTDRAKREHKKGTSYGQSGTPEVLLLSWYVYQRGTVGGCPYLQLAARPLGYKCGRVLFKTKSG